MASKNIFDITSQDTKKYEDKVDSIKAELELLENDISIDLKEFIKKMPQFKEIGNPKKTKYANEDEFWKGISAENDKDKISVDDLIKYIGENYNDEIPTQFLKQLQEKSKKAIEPIKEQASQLIEEQKKDILENEQSINEEKKLMQGFKTKYIECQSKQAELMAERDSYEPTSDEYKTADIKCKKNEAYMKHLINLYQTNKKNILAHQNNLEAFKTKLKAIEDRMKGEFEKRNILLEDEPQTDKNDTDSKTKTQNNGVANGNAQTENNVNREKAKKMLKYLQETDSKKIPELLKGREFGDILEMKKNLSWIDRRKLENLLKKNAKANGIDISGELKTNEYKRINTFLEHISEKTPEQIERFEKELEKVEYMALIKGGNNKEITAVRAKLTKYYDAREERTTRKNQFRSSLAVAIGRKPIQITEKQKLSERASNKTKTENGERDW